MLIESWDAFLVFGIFAAHGTRIVVTICWLGVPVYLFRLAESNGWETMNEENRSNHQAIQA
jgi:hypothetical protein